MALPGVELAAGTYMFELASANNNSVVRVSSADRRKHYLLALTYAVDRPASLAPGQAIVLGEAARGQAPQVQAWFPDGQRQGRHFIY